MARLFFLKETCGRGFCYSINSSSPMKNTLLTVSLLSAAAAAAAQSASSPAMSYDFVRVGFAQDKYLDGMNVSASALLGEHIIVGGQYQDLDGRDFDGNGESTAFLLGARFGVGSGDIIVSAAYGQVQGAAFDAGTLYVLAGNTTTLSVSYRHSFSDTWEAFVGLSNIRTEWAAGGYNFETGDFGAAANSTSENAVSVAVRCNLSKEFDVTASHGWVGGEGTWSLSVGYNF
jgi:hypothetical protein